MLNFDYIMKRLLLYIVVLLSFRNVYSQGVPYKISSDNYHKLKKEGKLTGGERIYNATGATQELHITNTSKESARNNTNNSVMATPCNCWIPRDGTFSAVPFDLGSPPYYSNDDGSTVGITLPFNFCLYGNTVGGASNQMYINNNGNISFGSSYSTFSPVGFPSSLYTMIAPFWGDVDTENPPTNGGVVYYKLTPTYLIVQWDSVGVFDHTGQVNTFQLIITDGTDPILPAGNNISFCYGEMQWTTGDASNGGGTGFDGTPADPATVGLNKGDGTTFTQIGQFGVPGSTYAGSTGISGVGWLAGQSFYFNSCGAGGNLPPVVTSGGPPSACVGDTLTICSIGGTLVHTVSFIPPSTSGSVSVTATSPSVGADFSVTNSTSGASASLTFQVNSTGLTAGYYTVTVTATNDVPLSTTINYIIHVVNGTSFPSPAIVVTPSVNCGSTPSVVTLTNSSSYTTYTWSTGATTPSITVANTSTVQVAVSQAGCVNTGSVAIQISPSPTITVNSPTICVGTTATLTAGGAVTYTWNPSATLSSDTGTIVTGTPTATTHYTVTGRDGNGCKDSTITTIAVNTSPTITATSSTICVGQQTATLTAGGAVTYIWNTGATTSTITASPITTTSYTVTGTSASSCTAIAVGTISVTPLPTTTVNLGTICPGNTTTLTAGGATNYTWTPNTGLTFTSNSVAVANPPTTTAYTIIGAIGTCTSLATTTVSIISAITPTVTSSTPCANQTLTLTCTPATYTNYAWSGPNLYTSAVPNPIRTGVTAADAGTYTLHVTDAGGCTNVAMVNVVVNPLPVVTANASPACLHQTVNLSCTPNGDIYSWSFGGVAFSNSQNPSIANVTIAATGQYEVTVTDGHGCSNGNTIQVSVYPLPIVTVASPLSICISSTGTLTASGALNYIWNPVTDLNSNVGNQVLLTPTSMPIHTYTITGQDANGCVNTAITSIIINELPIVSIAPDSTKGCTPQCATYTVMNNPAAKSYNWNFGNGQTKMFLPPNNTATICYTTSGNYLIQLTLTDINGCVNTATANVITYPIPVPEFAYTPNPAMILTPNIQFLNQSSGAIITSYNWNFGDASGMGSTLYNPNYTYLDTGTYYITLTDTSINGCSASIVKPLVIEPDVTLYVPTAFTPNGDGKNEIFKAQGDGILAFKMYVFDRWGNTVFTTTDIDIGWNGRRNNTGGETVQEDIYVWKIDLSNVNNKQGRSYTGIVTLLK